MVRRLYRKNRYIDTPPFLEGAEGSEYLNSDWDWHNFRATNGGTGSDHWAVPTCDPPGGYADIHIDIEVPSIYMTARTMQDVGTYNVKIDGHSVFTLEGPSGWEYCPPIKLLPGHRRITIEFDNFDQKGGSLGANRLWDTIEIMTQFCESTPFKQESEIKEFPILRGFTDFATSNKGYAKSEFKLLFYTAPTYLDFMSNIDKQHIIQDELGIWYRGVIQVGDVERISDGIYYVSCEFKSPYKAGMGW